MISTPIFHVSVEGSTLTRDPQVGLVKMDTWFFLESDKEAAMLKLASPTNMPTVKILVLKPYLMEY